MSNGAHVCLSMHTGFGPGSYHFLQTSLTWIQGEYFSFEVGMQLRVQGPIVGELEASFPKLSEIKGTR